MRGMIVQISTKGLSSKHNSALLVQVGKTSDSSLKVDILLL